MNKKMKIIGKCNNLFLVAFSEDANINNLVGNGMICDDKGRIIASNLPLVTLFRDNNWMAVLEETYYEKNVTKDIVRDALIGAAVGDAFGVPYEFLSRNDISKLEIRDMIGSDTKNNFVSRWNTLIPSGCWSDDTSMILATMDSIIENKSIDYNDIILKYMSWLKEGKYSSMPYAFGLGNIIDRALNRYSYGVPPLECGCDNFKDNGNGSLMRILPISLYCILNEFDDETMCKTVCDASSITHAHEISKMACVMYTIFLKEIVNSEELNLYVKENAKGIYLKLIYGENTYYASNQELKEYIL